MIGIIKGFSGLLNPQVPHVHLNPLFHEIPELDPTRGGTILGASRDYVDGNDTETIARVAERLQRLKIEGLICVGGDGTINGMQPLSDHLPVVLAPKTIDNDLGPELPGRAQRVVPRAGPGHAQGVRLQEAAVARLRARRDGQLRDPRVTPPRSTSRRSASSGSGRRPRATGGSRSSRSWAATAG